MSFESLSPASGRAFRIHKCWLDGEDFLEDFVELQAWEGLNQGLCEAMVVFASSQRKWADWDETAEHFLEIEFSEIRDDDSTSQALGLLRDRPTRWSRRFEVMGLTKYVLDSVTQQEVVNLSLGNPGILEDLRIRLSRSYNTYLSDMVRSALGHLKISNTLDIQRTGEKRHVVTPNVSPLSFIAWCSTQALNEFSQSGRWMLWEDNAGIHWKDTTDLLGPTHEFTAGQDQDRANDIPSHIPETAIKPGVSLDKYDWMLNGQTGMQYLEWDSVSRELTSGRVSRNSPFYSDRAAGTVFDWNAAEQKSRRMVGKRSSGIPYMTVDIPGMVGICPGDVFSLTHRDPNGDIVPKTSGRWIIRAIKTTLNRDSYRQAIEVYK